VCVCMCVRTVAASICGIGLARGCAQAGRRPEVVCASQDPKNETGLPAIDSGNLPSPRFSLTTSPSSSGPVVGCTIP